MTCRESISINAVVSCLVDLTIRLCSVAGRIRKHKSYTELWCLRNFYSMFWGSIEYSPRVIYVKVSTWIGGSSTVLLWQMFGFKVVYGPFHLSCEAHIILTFFRCHLIWGSHNLWLTRCHMIWERHICLLLYFFSPLLAVSVSFLWILMHTCADCVPALHEFRSDWIDRCMDGGMDKITLIWRFACEKSGCCWSHKLQWLFFFFICFSFFFFFFFLLSSSFSPRLLRRPFFLLSPSSSWGACARLPRPYLGWCPTVGVRVLLATSLPLLLLLLSSSSPSSFSPCLLRPFSSFCLLPLLWCVCWFTTSWPGVVSQCWGACVSVARTA